MSLPVGVRVEMSFLPLKDIVRGEELRFLLPGPWSLFPVILGHPEGPLPEEVRGAREQFCGRGEDLFWLRGGHTKNYVFLFFCLKWYVFKHAFSVMNSSSAFGYKERSISRRSPRVQCWKTIRPKSLYHYYYCCKQLYF